MGCHALLQGIFPTQGSNPGLPHGRQILHHPATVLKLASAGLSSCPPAKLLFLSQQVGDHTCAPLRLWAAHQAPQPEPRCREGLGRPPVH